MLWNIYILHLGLLKPVQLWLDLVWERVLNVACAGKGDECCVHCTPSDPLKYNEHICLLNIFQYISASGKTTKIKILFDHICHYWIHVLNVIICKLSMIPIQLLPNNEVKSFPCDCSMFSCPAILDIFCESLWIRACAGFLKMEVEMQSEATKRTRDWQKHAEPKRQVEGERGNWTEPVWEERTEKWKKEEGFAAVSGNLSCLLLDRREPALTGPVLSWRTG